MFLYVCAHMRVCMHAYMFLYVYARACMCACVCVRACVCVCVCVCTRAFCVTGLWGVGVEAVFYHHELGYYLV